MKISNILIAAVLMASLCGCKNTKNEPRFRRDPALQAVQHGFLHQMPGKAEMAGRHVIDRKVKQGGGAQPAAATQAARQQKNTQAETIYVETDGAQGRVWGHVTMKGDRGTGTIHDWDENTLTVSVTRHGDELFATDQNSRQYVFKLKQNKTQE